MFIYFGFGFADAGLTIVGGGGAEWIIGTLNPGEGIPTGNPGTGFGPALSKSYGLLEDLV